MHAHNCILKRVGEVMNKNMIITKEGNKMHDTLKPHNSILQDKINVGYNCFKLQLWLVSVTHALLKTQEMLTVY